MAFPTKERMEELRKEREAKDKVARDAFNAEPTFRQLQPLLYAIEYLSKAVNCGRIGVVPIEARRASTQISEFFGSLIETPDLSEQEADIARGLHTAMRKFMDSPLSVMLYNLIHEDKGTLVWYSFIHTLAESKNIQRAIESASYAYHQSETSENMMVYFLLKMWAEGDDDVGKFAETFNNL